MMKEYDSEPDDDYTTCENMVHSYLGEANADHHTSPLNKSKSPLLAQLATKYLTP